MKKLLILALIGFAISPVFAQNHNVTQLLKDLNFKFQPDVLQPQGFGQVQGYYENGDGFPLWLLLSMDGPMIVTPDRYAVTNNQGSDTLWTVELTSVDSLNGLCKANFAVDPRDGRAAVTIITPQESVTYMGDVLPVVRKEQRRYKNNKIAAAADQTERILDECISKRNFTVHLNTETYGRRSYVILMPDKLLITRDRIQASKFEILCIEKVGDVWYVAIEIPSKTELKEASVLNLAIDAKTGDTNYRFGPWNNQRKNWLSMIDGIASENPENPEKAK